MASVLKTGMRRKIVCDHHHNCFESGHHKAKKYSLVSVRMQFDVYSMMDVTLGTAKGLVNLTGV